MNRKEFFKTSGTLLASSFLVNPLSARFMEKTIKSGRVKITTRIYELRLRQAWTLSRGTWDTRRNVLVRLERDGLVGYGEAAPIPRYEESAESRIRRETAKENLRLAPVPGSDLRGRPTKKARRQIRGFNERF